MTVYDIGDRPTVTATFTDADGVAADPTTVVVKTRTPAGTETTYTSGSSATIVDTATTGVWTFTFPAALAENGTYRVRFKGTAGLEAAGEIEVKVNSTQFASP